MEIIGLPNPMTLELSSAAAGCGLVDPRSAVRWKLIRARSPSRNWRPAIAFSACLAANPPRSSPPRGSGVLQRHQLSIRATASRPPPSTRPSRNRYAEIPAVPGIRPTLGGNNGSSLRCSTNRQYPAGPSWKSRSTKASASCTGNSRSYSPPPRCHESRKTSPTPAVPQQRQSLSQNPGCSRSGTSQCGTLSRLRRCQIIIDSPATWSTLAYRSAANNNDVSGPP